MLDLLDSPLGKAVRGTACVTVAILLLVVAARASTQQHKPEDLSLSPVAIEHRFTTLEEKVDQILGEISDMKITKWIEMVLMSGLIGERGIQLLRRKV